MTLDDLKAWLLLAGFKTTPSTVVFTCSFFPRHINVWLLNAHTQVSVVKNGQIIERQYFASYQQAKHYIQHYIQTNIGD